MAVTVQTYTATATWTAAQFASTLRTAFIDAGLMTDWYDSFLSGSFENRVLEVQYDNSKTYGKTYYWFKFSGAIVYFSVCAGFNATTHVPTGTALLDYISTSTSAATGHQTLQTFTAATNLTITRYSSGSVHWFLVRTGTTTICFHIPGASTSRPAWMDLNKNMYHLMLLATATASGNIGWVSLTPAQPLTRRSFVGSNAINGSSSSAGDATVAGQSLGRYLYSGTGQGDGSGSNYNVSAIQSGAILLPMHKSGANGNTAYASDSSPVFAGLPASPYINAAMPADFGVAFHFANNTFAIQDTFTVSAGTEVWEVMAFANGTNITGAATPLFLARTT